jgi:hypothetical protein
VVGLFGCSGGHRAPLQREDFQSNPLPESARQLPARERVQFIKESAAKGLRRDGRRVYFQLRQALFRKKVVTVPPVSAKYR